MQPVTLAGTQTSNFPAMERIDELESLRGLMAMWVVPGLLFTVPKAILPGAGKSRARAAEADADAAVVPMETEASVAG